MTRVVAHQVLPLLGILGREALEVDIALIGVEVDGGPCLARVVTLDEQDVLLVMVAQVEARGVEFARLQHDEDAVVAAELSEGLAATVVVQAEHVAVEPHLAPAERRRTTLLERDLVDLCPGEDVAERGATLDQYLAEILLEDERLLP